MIAFLFICMIALCGCTSDSDSTGSADTSLSERDRYANFEADAACSMMAVNSGDDIGAILNKVESLMNKHEFTADDVERLKAKYEGDSSFTNQVLEEMRVLCPESVDNIPV